MLLLIWGHLDELDIYLGNAIKCLTVPLGVKPARQRKPGGTFQVPALERASTRFRRGSLRARRKIVFRPELFR